MMLLQAWECLPSLSNSCQRDFHSTAKLPDGFELSLVCADRDAIPSRDIGCRPVSHYGFACSVSVGGQL